MAIPGGSGTGGEPRARKKKAEAQECLSMFELKRVIAKITFGPSLESILARRSNLGRYDWLSIGIPILEACEHNPKHDPGPSSAPFARLEIWDPTLWMGESVGDVDHQSLVLEGTGSRAISGPGASWSIRSIIDHHGASWSIMQHRGASWSIRKHQGAS